MDRGDVIGERLLFGDELTVAGEREGDGDGAGAEEDWRANED